MKASRYAVSRRKACLQCVAAKAKCDRDPTSCRRCSQRGWSCAYADPTPQPLSTQGFTYAEGKLESSVATDHYREEITSANDPCIIDHGSTNLPHIPCSRFQSMEAPLYANVQEQLRMELSCPINAGAISNRWLNPYISGDAPARKTYSSTVMTFLRRVLKSYAGVAIRGRGHPPFIHATQLARSNSPLVNCLTMVGICQDERVESRSNAVEIIHSAMETMYDHSHSLDDLGLLETFQAYLLSSMALFLFLDQSTDSFLRQALMNLQDLACTCSRAGLVCNAEQQRLRPRWESWIVAEAKRRTLYTMYMFDNTLSAFDGLPTFLGEELRGLPAPASQNLWKARARNEWEAAYDTKILDWQEDFRIDELWPQTAPLEDSERKERTKRTEQWLETIDEFGTMLYTVTSITHGI